MSATNEGTMTDDKRLRKAQELHANGVTPVAVGPNKWSVGSECNPQVTYVVENNEDFWLCECPDFMVRGRECKHILLVQLTERRQNKGRKCDKCLEARHNGPAEFSAGQHVWCNHSKTLVEPETKGDCDWFLDKSRLVIV
jgi:hypothetical protein